MCLTFLLETLSSGVVLQMAWLFYKFQILLDHCDVQEGDFPPLAAILVGFRSDFCAAVMSSVDSFTLFSVVCVPFIFFFSPSFIGENFQHGAQRREGTPFPGPHICGKASRLPVYILDLDFFLFLKKS